MRSNEPKAGGFRPDFTALEVSDEKFDKMLETTVGMVEAIGLNNKSMMPHLIIHHRHVADESGQFSDIEATVVGIDVWFEDSKEKREMLRGLGTKFFAEQEIPCAIFMASEAWTSRKAKDCIEGGMMPSQDPDRKEVLTISGRTISGDCKVGVIIPVKRDSNDVMIRDGENEVFKSKDIEMSLLDQFLYGFFDPIVSKYTPEEIRDLASKLKDRR